jgi:ABC-type transport system involved in multi-copper enzyme maturation permease subunit
MTAQLRSELLKQRTTRTTVLLLAWLVGLVLLVVGLHVASFGLDDLGRESNQMRILGLGTTLGVLFAALVGALSVTAEFRTGTIRPTLLITPRRTTVIVAKLAAGMLIGAAAGLLAQTLNAGAEAAGLALRGIEIGLGAGDYAQLLAGGALAGALFGALGVGVGALVRNQVTAVAALCVWLLLLEPLLLGDLPGVAKYAPEASAGAITGAIQSQLTDALVAPALGVVLLAVYVLVAAVAGALALNRRDVG